MMKLGNKQQYVLRLLQQQSASINLPKLLELLGPGYAERSVRRWLAQMTEAELVKKTGKKRGTQYRSLIMPYKNTPPSPAWQVEDPISIALSAQSQKALAYVRQSIFNRKPVTYQAAFLEAYQPNQTYYMPEQIRMMLQQAGQRTISQLPAGTYARQIYNRLLIDLSYNSSRLEGNTYSLLDTKNLVLKGARAQDKRDEETVMILNHKDAIRSLIDSAAKQDEINLELLRTLHYLLADSLIETGYAGHVRDYGVRISASSYIPLENKTLLEQHLMTICSKANAIQNPYEQSFFLLVHIAYLQAFADVNKRTSRLSANIPLVRNNLVPLSFNDVDKDDYLAAMIAVYEINETAPLLDIYKASYLRTCELYSVTIESMGVDEVRLRYRQLRRDILRHCIVEQLHAVATQTYIQQQAQQHIPAAEQEKFRQDMADDLHMLVTDKRTVGLGVTTTEFEVWYQIYTGSSV